jgi:hypothetical protein
MTTRCPICNEENTIDSWYHRENCTEKEARQARQAKHDETTAWGCRSIKLGKHGNSKIFADLPGLRVSDERTLQPQMVDWTDEVTTENATGANTNDTEVAEESSEDEEEMNKKCTSFNAPFIDPKWTQKYETGIESDTEELESIHSSEEGSEQGSDTDNEHGFQSQNPKIPNPRDDKLTPYSFEHERDSENEDELDHEIETDRTRWHYKRIGAIRHFPAGAFEIASTEGEYELLATLIDPESQAIFAHYRIHGKDTSETQQNNFTVPWRHARRTASRTIPAAIDPDADLNPDIVTLIGLPDGQRIPKKPTKKITIQFADTAIIREGKTGEAESIEQTARRKTRKYEPALKRLKKMGWSVDPKLRLIMVGIRGGIPNVTIKSLSKLGVPGNKIRASARRLSLAAEIRLARNLQASRFRENREDVRHRSAIAQQIWRPNAGKRSADTHNDPKGKRAKTNQSNGRGGWGEG